MKKIVLLMLVLFAAMMAFGCSKTNLTIDLNQYADIEESGYDTIGTCKGKLDYKRLLNENEEAIGADKVPALQRILRNVELTADKTENLKNGDIITLSWGTIETQAIFEEYGINFTFSDGVAATVDELTPLQEIDVFDYVQLKQEGYSLIGTASVYVVIDANPDLLEGLEFKADKTSDLTNGDKVKVSVGRAYSTEAVDHFAASLGYKLKTSEKEYVIDRLDECTSYDPFVNLVYTVEGMNGYGFLQDWECYSYFSDIYTIAPEKTEGFSNGDELVFTITWNEPVENIDKAAAYYGICIPRKEIRIPIEGLKDGVSDLSQLSTEALDSLQAEDEERMRANVSDNYIDLDVMYEMKYLGTVIAIDKERQNVDNIMLNVYKCDFVTGYDEPHFIYLYAERDNVYVTADGSVEPHEVYTPFDINYWGDCMEFFESNAGYSYYGFNSLDALLEAKLTGCEITFNNAADCAMEHHIIIPEVYAYAAYSDDGFNATYDGSVTVGESAPLLTGEGEYTIKIPAKNLTYRNAGSSPLGIANLEITITNGIELFDKLGLQITDVKIKCDSEEIPVDLSRVMFKPKNETDYMLSIYSVYSGQPKEMSAVDNSLISFTKAMKITIVIEKQ